jgi:GntR family transcriptional regulator
MIISIDLYNSKPAYLQITDAVRKAIAVGALQPGDRLPPIRETAVHSRVNRNTVSRAYLELEHQGLVQARQGSGFFVTEGGAIQERATRRDSVLDKIHELLDEAALAGLSTRALIDLVESEARATQTGKRSELSKEGAE